MALKRNNILAWKIHIQAPADIVWQNITEVDLSKFEHPRILNLLGVPKALRAEFRGKHAGGLRIAYFSNDKKFTQKILEWAPHSHYSFTFEPDPGFRVAYFLDLQNGPFRMKSGAYRLRNAQDVVELELESSYELEGVLGMILALPVRVVLLLFQRNLLLGIKRNSEAQDDS